METVAGNVTQAGMVIGTMPYISPEQVEGRPADPRSDLFSLGVVFYELLTGQRPFAGSSPAALMSASSASERARFSVQSSGRGRAFAAA